MVSAEAHIATEHYRTVIESGGHILIADEPARDGGTDQGMSPSALLLASLGSCTAITLRMYADRKKWPLESVEVSLTLRTNKEDGKNQTFITKELNLKGDLSGEQKKRLVTIAENCPVQKMLESAISISTGLYDEQSSGPVT